MTQDESNLNLLSIFHFVLGGLTALISCFPFIHLLFGVLMLTEQANAEEEIPAFVAWLFICIPATLILMGWALSICMIVAGLKLKKRKAYTFCVVIACIECLMMPFGTLLGVFTLIMLYKEPIKALFYPATPPPMVR
ncbi:hypothetical protein P3T73_16750 [Kiritimatiellota bacterium B12222]|nr:hypothetical protein P3T73_16750 [Kiritimatiellota bacterium B12222]